MTSPGTPITTFRELTTQLPLRQLRGQALLDAHELTQLMADPHAHEVNPDQLPVWGQRLHAITLRRQGRLSPEELAAQLDEDLLAWEAIPPNLSRPVIPVTEIATRVTLLGFVQLLYREETTAWALGWSARIPHLATCVTEESSEKRDRHWLRGQLARNVAPGQEPSALLGHTLLIRSNAAPQDWRDVAGQTWRTRPLPRAITSATDLIPWMHLTPTYHSSAALLPGMRREPDAKVSGLARALSGREVPLDDNGQVRMQAQWLTLLEAAGESGTLDELSRMVGSGTIGELSDLLGALHHLTNTIFRSPFFDAEQRRIHRRLLSAAWQMWQAATQALSSEHREVMAHLRPAEDPQRPENREETT